MVFRCRLWSYGRCCAALLAWLLGLVALPAIGPELPSTDDQVVAPAPAVNEELPAQRLVVLIAHRPQAPPAGLEAAAASSFSQPVVVIVATYDYDGTRVRIRGYVGTSDPVNRWDPSGLNWIWNGGEWVPHFIFDPDVPRPTLGFMPEDNAGDTLFTFDDFPNYLSYLHDLPQNAQQLGVNPDSPLVSELKDSVSNLAEQGVVNFRLPRGDDIIASNNAITSLTTGLTQFWVGKSGKRSNRELFIADVGRVQVDPATIALLEAMPQQELAGVISGTSEFVSDNAALLAALGDAPALIDQAIGQLQGIDFSSVGPEKIAEFVGGMAEAEVEAFNKRREALGTRGAITATLTKTSLETGMVGGVSRGAKIFGPARRGRAPEFPSGRISQDKVLDHAEDYLGPGYREVSPGRYVSADGKRQFRYGRHETKDASNHHAHFEALEDGRVVENAVVEIVE